MIAPSHGQIYDKPAWIIDAYRDWTDEKPHNLVVLPYVSMHGSTRQMVDYLVSTLSDRGVSVELFILGSYGWGGKTIEVLAGMIPNLKVELIDPVLCKGVPSEADFKALDKMADAIVQKHRGAGLL